MDTNPETRSGQMINYLRIAMLRVGILLNFKHTKLEWERIIL